MLLEKTICCNRVAEGNAPASGVEAMRQLYASGMAGSHSAAASASAVNKRSFQDEEIEDEYLPKKAAAPEVISYYHWDT